MGTITEGNAGSRNRQEVTADTLRALSILLKELLRSSGSRTFTRVGGERRRRRTRERSVGW